MAGAYPCYGTYRAADGRWLAVGALEVQFWRAFCAGLGRDDLVVRQFDPAAVAEVAGVLASRSSAAWLARFDDDACVALVREPAEALDDPYVRMRGGGARPSTPAPRLGADTDDVLAEAAVAPTRVAQLRKAGVVTGTQTPARAARAARLGAMLARRRHPGVQQSA